jgi:hypothetical protein
MQIGQVLVDRSGLVAFSGPGRVAQGPDLGRSYVGRHGNYAIAAGQHEFTRARVVSAQEDKVRATATAKLRDPTDFSGRLFDSDDLRMICKLDHRRRPQVDGRAAGDVVKDDRLLHGIRNGAVVAHEASLGGLVVVGRDHEEAGYRQTAGRDRELERLLGRIGACARNNRNAAICEFAGLFQQLQMLVMRQGRRLSGRAGDHECLGPRFHVEIDQRCKLAIADSAVGVHRRHQRNHAACQHLTRSAGRGPTMVLRPP